MTPEQKAAYVSANAAAALIEAMGMAAENMIQDRRGLSLAYDSAAFYDVIDKHCIQHNQMIELFNE